jgi:hypothetical protein
MVTSDDYAPIDIALHALRNHLTVPTASWVNGDVNLDGAITSDDYAPIDIALHAARTGHPYATLYPSGIASAGGITPVPEPSTIVLGFLAVACFLGFRKFWK